MTALRYASLAMLLAPPMFAQDPVLSPNAPRDNPGGVEQAAAAHLDSLMQRPIAQARATYPQAKARYLKGLPNGETFFVTTRLTDSSGRFEQAFIVVDSIKGATVYGRIWSQIQLLRGYHLRQPVSFPESQVIDWLITMPDGSEEGNFVGKFMDSVMSSAKPPSPRD